MSDGFHDGMPTEEVCTFLTRKELVRARMRAVQKKESMSVYLGNLIMDDLESCGMIMRVDLHFETSESVKRAAVEESDIEWLKLRVAIESDTKIKDRAKQLGWSLVSYIARCIQWDLIAKDGEKHV